MSWSLPPEHPENCRLWFERMWSASCTLRARYRLPLRRGWWEHPLQLEVLAALAEWVARYDDGDWDDPAGKIGLLLELPRLEELLREGSEPFAPERDRPEFVAYVNAVVAGLDAEG